MSDVASREWRFYLDDMIQFAEKVIAYTDGIDNDTLWSIIRDDIRPLLDKLVVLKATLP